MTLLALFFRNLPARPGRPREQPLLLNEADRARIVTRGRLLATLAALLSVAGFLAYYLPVYWFPQVFPTATVTMPVVESTVQLAWGELLWAALLAALEMGLLTLLNIAGVREVAIATGFLHAANASTRAGEVLHIGLENQTTDVTRFGIDPFQGASRWAILAFNLLLRLKGWLGNRIIRFLTRALLVRYAARAVLDFAGLPLYMAINAYSVLRVTREAKVVMLGERVVERFVDQLPRMELSPADRELLYDTLQYIAVSKRDFHRNHYLLTKGLLARFGIPVEETHPLPDDFLQKLERSPVGVRSLCHTVILLGFILDGRLSWRERRRLQALNVAGILKEDVQAVRQHLGNLMQGRGVDSMIQPGLRPEPSR